MEWRRERMKKRKEGELESEEKSAIPVLSFAAYSGTGKTTLLEKLIPALKRRGFRLCVMKHDAHEFEVDREGKDSQRMTQAGADVTLLTNGAHAVLFENRPIGTAALLAMVRDVDLILTEGYKHGPWRKVALHRAALGKPFPCPVEDCLAVVTDTPLDADVPCFGFEDIEPLADLIANAYPPHPQDVGKEETEE